MQLERPASKSCWTGDRLLLEADAEPPRPILDRLASHKPGIMALLRPGDDGWSPEDWRACYDERAAILEFDGGLPRTEAEARAFACCVAKWLNNHPVSSPPDYCLGCGAPDQAHDPLQPFGDVWLHSHCWPAWYASRNAEAADALRTMRIIPGCTNPTQAHKGPAF